ncbi:FAD-dependent monooxygenase [Nonomuraea sp. NPDC003754]
MDSVLNADAVIVGAGLGGCFLACLLGARGQRVVVVERGPSIGSRGADFVKAPGLRVLERHGLLPSVAKRGALRRQAIRYFHDGVAIGLCDFGPEGFLILPYKELVEAVAGECQGVTFMFDSQIGSIAGEPRGTKTITIVGGPTLRAGVVVGADGSRSSVRPLVGGHGREIPYAHHVRMAVLPLVDSVAEHNRLYFGSEGLFANFYPLDAHRARAFVGLTSERDAELFEDTADLAGKLRPFVTQSDDVLAQVGTVQWHRIPLTALRTTRYHEGGAIVLGGAAFGAHPMTGMGMSYTLEDAEIVADAVSEAGSSLDRLHDLLEERYEPRRVRHEELVSYGDRLAGAFPDRDLYLRSFDAELHVGEKGSFVNLCS